MHIDETLLVKLVYHLVVLGLCQQVILLDKESGLLEEIEPEFIASWEVGQGTLV